MLPFVGSWCPVTNGCYCHMFPKLGTCVLLNMNKDCSNRQHRLVLFVSRSDSLALLWIICN